MTTLSPAEETRAVMARAEAGDASSQLRVSQLFRNAGDIARSQAWLDTSIAQGFPPAFCERGLQRLMRMDIAGALSDLDVAARGQDGRALLALAGLACTGAVPDRGGWPEAMALLVRAAGQGNKAAWRELALLTAMAGSWAASHDLMAHAAALGDGNAVHAVLWRAVRGGPTLDADRTRAYRAALASVRFPLDPPPGEAVSAPFPPAGPAPTIDWEAVTTALANPPGLAFPQAGRLSSAPDVWIAKRFFTDEECDYVVAQGASALTPAAVIDPVSGERRRDPVRTNLAAAEATVWMSPVKAALALRLARLAGMPLSHAEPASLLCYRPGEEYRPHFDWLGPGPAFDAGGQRMKTVLVYLNDEYAGGRTRFLTPGLDIPAAKGDAALFVNVTPEGAPDMTTRHAGMPVTGGVKFVWSQWYRAREARPLTQ